MKNLKKSIIVVFVFFGFLPGALSQISDVPLVLSEMTWEEVQSYLEDNDMVIIPLGSNEQHGKHLPTGTDFLAALEFSKRISAQSNVMVAPILMVGYSEYHSGFPGTLSISPETMEQVVFECAVSLINYGFRRILFFNGHGGNTIVQENLIHRINSTTAATAVSIGVGSPLWPTTGIDSLDWHAGKFETSLDLCLFPDLVQLDKAEKPVITFPESVNRMISLSEEYPDLNRIWDGSMVFLPEETGKATAVRDMTSNGVISLNDPKDASTDYGQPFVEEIVDRSVALIKAWRLADQPK